MNMTTKELAARLKISVTRVNVLRRQGKIAREANGTWDLARVERALRANLDSRQVSPARGATEVRPEGRAPVEQPQHHRPRSEPAPAKGTLAFAQLQHELAKAATAAIQAQRLEGKLIAVELVRSEWTSIAAAIRSALLALPARIVNRCPAEWRHTLLAVVQEEVRATLSALSDEVRNPPQAA